MEKAVGMAFINEKFINAYKKTSCVRGTHDVFYYRKHIPIIWAINLSSYPAKIYMPGIIMKFGIIMLLLE